MNTILPFGPQSTPGPHITWPSVNDAPPVDSSLSGTLPLLHEEYFQSPPGQAPGHDEDATWRPTLLGQMLNADGPAARRQAVESLVHSLGFSWLGYGRFWHTGDRLVPRSYCTTYGDKQWIARYFHAGYHRVDPRLNGALQSSLPWVWSIDELQRAALMSDLPPDQQTLQLAFLDDVRAVGARSGAMLALPISNLMPGAHAPALEYQERHVVSLVSRTEGSLWMTDAVLGQVLTLAFCLHELYVRHPPPLAATSLHPAGGLCASLTPLQLAVLDCVAQGLGDKQIAARLKLTPSNVDYHMRQLRRRFAVRNRVQLTQAALRAGMA